MLASEHRMRNSADFSVTVRSGARTGRRNLVLYAAGTGGSEPSRYGFIVARSVGNAVTRNLVKRRLRAAAAQSLHERPEGITVVVRALPAAAQASWEQLASDYRGALTSSLGKLDSPRHAGRRSGDGQGTGKGGNR